ncbi:MAG: hypothetical protein V1708_03300 [Candidatus Micrarchaeota archaeon]
MELWEKYPFCEEARKRARASGEQSVSGAEISHASEKVLSALNGRPVAGGLSAKEYALARLLLAASGNRYAFEKFAQEMAARYAREIAEGGEPEMAWAAAEFFPGAKIESDENYSIPVLQYANAGRALANEAVEAGRVFLSARAMLKLIEKAIKARILEVKADSTSLPAQVKEAAKELSESAPKAVAPAAAFKGKYLSLPALAAIAAGVGEGKRYYASLALANACSLDGLAKEQAMEVMRAFAKNCSRSTHDFTEKEALATMEWVYRHPPAFFYLKPLRDAQIVDEETLAKTSAMLRQGRQGAGRATAGARTRGRR